MGVAAGVAVALNAEDALLALGLGVSEARAGDAPRGTATTAGARAADVEAAGVEGMEAPVAACRWRQAGRVATEAGAGSDVCVGLDAGDVCKVVLTRPAKAAVGAVAAAGAGTAIEVGTDAVGTDSSRRGWVAGAGSGWGPLRASICCRHIGTATGAAAAEPRGEDAADAVVDGAVEGGAEGTVVVEDGIGCAARETRGVLEGPSVSVLDDGMSKRATEPCFLVRNPSDTGGADEGADEVEEGTKAWGTGEPAPDWGAAGERPHDRPPPVTVGAGLAVAGVCAGIGAGA